MKIFLVYIGFVAIMCLLTCFTYLSDKRRAKKEKWRIKESVLLGLGFFGGAAGALIAMNIFRHKTKHWYFWAANIFFLLLQIVAAIWIYLELVIS